MALDDVPLEDAGRDYYARQFGNRVRNIRKYGATPPSRNPGGRTNRLGAVGGVVALLFVIGIIVAAVTGVSGPSSSSYNNYNSYQSPTMPSTAPIDWNGNMQGEPHPWQVQPRDLPDFQPDVPVFPPDPPVIFDPNPLPPPNAPGDDDKLPDKDD
jgi:hypothetical protein